MSNSLTIVEDNYLPVLQASKWMQLRILFGENEIIDFFDQLKGVSIYRIGTILPLSELEVQKDVVVDHYLTYLNCLKNGRLPDLSAFRRFFSLAMTLSQEALFAFKVSENEYLIKIAQPLIQVQAHFMHYSQYDHKFRPMTFGSDCITWGLQFSFPQIYRDLKTLDITKTDRKESELPNYSLFKNLQRWQRYTTMPTPFLTVGGAVNSPIRLGKSCLSWVNHHPQFEETQIKVRQS